MQTEGTLARARESAAEIERLRGKDFAPRVVSFGAIVGGREGNPNVFWGHAVAYTDGGETRYKFWPNDEIRDWRRAVYVVDNVPMYVAGWQGDGRHGFAPDGYALLHPMDVMTHYPHHMPCRAYFVRVGTIPALKGERY